MVRPMSESIWAGSLDALYDFVMYVVLYAPNFPRKDFLSDDQQLTVDKAFAEMNGAMEMVRAKIPDAAAVAKIQEVLGSAHAAYQAGDRKKGAHLLQEFRRLAFPHRNPP
jgi:hypothetical protein